MAASRPSINRQIVLASRPEAAPVEGNFDLVETPVPEPGEGEALVRALYLSLDPYMRGRMRDAISYAPPLAIGEVMTGGMVGEVVQSKAAELAPGDLVEGVLGWQDYAVAKAKHLRKVGDVDPPSLALGVLGMPGLTAYFGLLDLCAPKRGETVVVSAASGAVGAVVGQIAKLKGCHAVGIAGSDAKVDYIVNELGFDAGINYKTAERMTRALDETCPGGIDIYFDNVGGPITDAVMIRINERARLAICGQISQYNNAVPEMGPRNLFQLISKRARIEGFLVFDYAARYAEGLAQLSEWIASGRIKYREDIVDGLENAPSAFIGLLAGENFGKRLIRI